MSESINTRENGQNWIGSYYFFVILLYHIQKCVRRVCMYCPDYAMIIWCIVLCPMCDDTYCPLFFFMFPRSESRLSRALESVSSPFPPESPNGTTHHLPALNYGIFCGNKKYFPPWVNPVGEYIGTSSYKIQHICLFKQSICRNPVALF